MNRRGMVWLAPLLSAGLLYLAWPPVDFSILVFVALVPLYRAAYGPAGQPTRQFRSSRRRRPGFGRQFLLGYLTFAIFLFLHLNWLLRLSKEEVTVPWIMVPALGAIGIYLGIYAGFAVAISGWIQRRASISPIWTLPVFWMLFDRFRSLGETGFPWGSFGYALAPWPAALQGTAITGYWALPMWILFVNGLIWWAWTGRQPKRLGGSRRGGPRRETRWAWAMAALLIPILYGYVVLSRAPGTLTLVEPDRSVGTTPEKMVPPRVPTRTDSAVRFAIVQANTSREIKWEEDYRELVLQDLLAQTGVAVDAVAPDLVVWPETAAPLRVLWQRKLSAMVVTTIDSLDTWTLVGTLDAEVYDDRPTEHFNAAILFDPQGTPVKRYHKRNMVPFGERTPYVERFPILGKIYFGQSDFTRGRTDGRFNLLDDRSLSCLICFESTFPEMARNDVASGAEYLVNITNDFWFGTSEGPLQHAQFSYHRAVENRTALIRCANTGISLIVDPYGRVHGATDMFVQDLLVADVEPNGGGSFYSRTGDWIVWVALVIGLAFFVIGASAPIWRRTR